MPRLGNTRQPRLLESLRRVRALIGGRLALRWQVRDTLLRFLIIGRALPGAGVALQRNLTALMLALVATVEQFHAWLDTQGGRSSNQLIT
jgi:hypothetical protein